MATCCLTGAPKRTELGILVFDVTSAPASFVAENPDLLAKFLKVTAAANAKPGTIGSGPGGNAAGNRARMPAWTKSRPTVDHATRSCSRRCCRPAQRQVAGRCNAQTFMKGVADVFVQAGSIDNGARHLRQRGQHRTVCRASSNENRSGGGRLRASLIGVQAHPSPSLPQMGGRPPRRSVRPSSRGGWPMSSLLIDDISMRFELPNGDAVQALKNVTLDIKAKAS